MVGDNAKKDIKGAKDAGLKTCFAGYGTTKKLGKLEEKIIGQHADYEIKNISEILVIIRHQNRKH